jgi:hypothetical protein
MSPSAQPVRKALRIGSGNILVLFIISMSGKVIAAVAAQLLYILVSWALVLRCFWLEPNCRQQRAARKVGTTSDASTQVAWTSPGSLIEAFKLGRAIGLWEAGALLGNRDNNASDVLARYGFNASDQINATSILGIEEAFRSQEGHGRFVALLSLGNLLYAVSAIGMAVFLVPTLWFVGKPIGRAVMDALYWAAGHLWQVVLLLKPALPAIGYVACFLALAAADHIPKTPLREIAVTACHMAATGISAYEHLGIVLAAEGVEGLFELVQHADTAPGLQRPPIDRSRMVRKRCAVPVLVFATATISSSAVLYDSSYLGCYTVVLSYLLLNFGISYSCPDRDWPSDVNIIRVNQVAALCQFALLAVTSMLCAHCVSMLRLGVSLFGSLLFCICGYIFSCFRMDEEEQTLYSYFSENVIYLSALALGMVLGSAHGLFIIQNMAVAFIIIWVLTKVAFNVRTMGQASFALFMFFALVGWFAYKVR